MPRRVLIVDDEQKLCQLLASGLAKRGFSVAWRTSAPEALDLLGVEEFDAVVTDVHMPGMSGIELCARIGRRWPALPVVVMTASGGRDTIAAALAAGARSFLEKPFGASDLERTLDGVLATGAPLRTG